MKRALLAAAVAAFLQADAAPRSKAARAEFVRSHACPSTGRHRLPCPGYEIDHRIALVCGGADEADNLQWLTIEAHKAKTRAEVPSCRRTKAARLATP